MSLRYFEIAEANHTIQNPLTEANLMLLGEICDLKPGMRQLDLACGQGEMLCRWAQKHGISGTGVDISHVFIDSARNRADELGVLSQVTFVQGDAAQYQPQEQYDIVSCIGATWIGGGTVGTLELMKKALKPSTDHLLLVGEIYYRDQPNAEAAQAMGLSPDAVTDIEGLLYRFEEAGVMLVEMVTASQQDFDRYASKSWMTAYHWLKNNPNDPDAPGFRQWIKDGQHIHLKYQRAYLGWGVFVLKLSD